MLTIRVLPRSCSQSAASLLGAILLSCIILPRAANAGTRRVPSDYPTIQSAVDAALEGDVVLVAPGMYAESTTAKLLHSVARGLVTAVVFLKPGVALVSEAGPGATIIDGTNGTVTGIVAYGGLLARSGQESTSLGKSAMGAADATTRIEGFTIRHASFALYAEQVELFVTHNTISNRVDVRGDTRGVFEQNVMNGGSLSCISSGPEGPIWRNNRFEPPTGGLICRCHHTTWQENTFADGMGNLLLWQLATTDAIDLLNNTFINVAVEVDKGHSHVANNRFQGVGRNYPAAMLITTDAGLIENNVITHWGAGLAAGGGEYRYNTIDGCGFGVNGMGNAYFHDNTIINSTDGAMSCNDAPYSVIENNDITDNNGNAIDIGSAPVIKGNLVLRNRGIGIASDGGTVEGNIVSFNLGDGIRFGPGLPPRIQSSGIHVIGNTIVGNGARGLVVGYLLSNDSVERNLVAFNQSEGIDCGAAGPVLVSCNDAYRNGIADYGGHCGDRNGTNGNIELDPLLCDREAGELGLLPGSPCAPENSGGCGLIGALPVSCGGIAKLVGARRGAQRPAVELRSWGSIKGTFIR